MKLRTLLIVFFAALIVEIAANLLNLRSVQYFSKPSLMLFLICYFVLNSKNLPKLKNLIIAALVFAWFGDCVLLIERQFPSIFVLGLVCFLIAHVFYVIFFWKIRKLNLKNPKINYVALFAVLIYSGALYSLVFLGAGHLRIPVVIYTAVISLMLMISLNAFDLRSQSFGKICVVGTVLFAISDSILALNRFAFSIYFSSALVMFSYAIAQLLITEGALKNLRFQQSSGVLKA